MPRITPGRKTISITLPDEEYDEVKRIAAKECRSMSDVGRDFISQGLNGTLNSNNIDFLAPIIREQLESVLSYYMERAIALEAKTCIQAGTAAYLAADAILKFVPPQQREDVTVSYNQAKKKAIQYMKSKVDRGEE